MNYSRFAPKCIQVTGRELIENRVNTQLQLFALSVFIWLMLQVDQVRISSNIPQ